MLDKCTVLFAFISSLSLYLSDAYAQSVGVSIKQNNPRHLALKEAIFDKPYENLPHYKVNRTLFKNKDKNSESHLLIDARRTLADSRDLLDQGRGQKLLQANGICFSGEWIINQDSGFSGLFRPATRVPVIARASVSFSGTKQNQRRALGLAVKLLPDNLGVSPSLNIFTLHSIGGVKTDYLLDLGLDNEPPLGQIPRLRDIPTALKLKKELLKADKEAGSEQPNVTFRTISPVAAYRETKVNTPRWIRFGAANDTRVNKLDFRDELRVENYPNNSLVYNIELGNHHQLKKSNAHWQVIGQLVFTESITSKACDTRLHFPHPKN